MLNQNRISSKQNSPNTTPIARHQSESKSPTNHHTSSHQNFTIWPGPDKSKSSQNTNNNTQNTNNRITSPHTNHQGNHHAGKDHYGKQYFAKDKLIRWGWQLPLFPGFSPPLPPVDDPPVPSDLDDTLPEGDIPGQLLLDLDL